MFRSLFIALSKAEWAQRLVARWKIAWKVASRFVAGNTIEEAFSVVRDFNGRGINVTLDHLGESTTSLLEAKNATDEILKLLEEIRKSDLSANVSIKLTQIGLALDEGVCAQNLALILSLAKECDNFVRIDMEDAIYTSATIKLYRQMRGKGFSNCGVVIQAYLFRTEKDVEDLLDQKTPIRLVKGAYKEPVELAFPKKKDVDANFDDISARLLDAAKVIDDAEKKQIGRIPPLAAFGTHDPKRILFIKDYAERLNLPRQAFEFQMLFGIRRDLQVQCHQEGYAVRVYVPYGTHWYPYFMRRLAERPANLWFFISNFFKG